MRISFAPSAGRDIIWFRAYYRDIFPQGAHKASEKFEAAVSALVQNPFIGHVIDTKGRRQFTIPKTSFLIVYRIQPETVRIIRVWDGRRNPDSK